MYGYCWESKWLELTHTRFQISKRADRSPVRILLLSDLHWSSFDPLDFLMFAFRLGASENPDFICLTGDLICVDNEYILDEYRPTLKALAGMAPTYAVLGNHDGGKWSRERNGLAETAIMEEMLRDSGMDVLHNRSVRIASDDRVINLVGVPDLWAGGIDAASAFSEVDPSAAEITIVIAHNPDSKDLITEYDWQLMLCGHTHGGQIAFPLIGAPYVPVEDKRFISGLNPWNDRWIYTTRGVGSLYGARFYCRPEVSIIDIA
jgi:predicted MPP superfamily phosphohydrolase